MADKQQPTFVYDAVLDFSLGMNSGVIPRLLPNNQAAFLSNVTVRGGFPTDRPAYRKITLSFSSDTIKAAMEGGLFQGATWYNPDFGDASLRAAIGGRLFQFTPDATVNAVVIDLTIPGDPNPATSPQAWLWQAEKWTIWSDGISPLVFTDETFSRRSNYVQQTIAVTAADFTPPTAASGTPFPVTLSVPYTGQYYVQTYIGGKLYEIIPDPTVNNIELTVVSDVAGTPHNVGTQVQGIANNISNLKLAGSVNTAMNPGAGSLPKHSIVAKFEIGFQYSGVVGENVQITNSITGTVNSWKITAILSTALQVTNNFTVNSPGYSYADGTLITLVSSTTSNIVLGTLLNAFLAPSIGSTVQALMSQPYTGTADATVYLDGAQYTIKALAPPVSSTLYLININAPVALVTAPQNLLTVPELPPGRMGVYGLGRNWMSLVDGKSYIGGDIVGGSSGSAAFNHRDAVLKYTENTYLSGGGFFFVPGNVGDIRAMIFAATLDSSLGQGALQILTPNIVYTCNAPVDRTTWQAMTNPIQTEVVISNGGLGQNSTVNMNSDTVYRSVVGIRTIKLTRQEFDTWSRTPISEEMIRVLKNDQKSLLPYSSAIVFDNRLLMTCSPVAGSQGVYHQGLIALDLAPISNMRVKLPPVYDGLWKGINILQMVVGRFNGIERAFAFTYNNVLEKIELYELLPTGDVHFDNDTLPIVKTIETAELTFSSKNGKTIFDLMKLTGGEMAVSDVIGRVDFQAFYQNDDYPCFVPWHSWSICAEKVNPLAVTPQDANLKPQFRSRMGLPEPSINDCDPDTKKPHKFGHSFQFKFIITGHCRFDYFRPMGSLEPQPFFAKPICEPFCEPPVVPEVPEFWNTAQSFTATCPDGQTGDPVTVTIPANSVAATTQAAADALAFQAATTQANASLICT